MSLHFTERRLFFDSNTSGMNRYTCPCCGYPTLSERGSYDICRLCNWEDDGQDDPHADEVWGGPNGGYSLSQARLNFDQHLIMYDPTQPTTRIGGDSNSELEHRAKIAIVKAFEAMQDETDPAKVKDLWRWVRVNEELLDRELRRRVGARKLGQS